MIKLLIDLFFHNKKILNLFRSISCELKKAKKINKQLDTQSIILDIWLFKFLNQKLIKLEIITTYYYFLNHHHHEIMFSNIDFLNIIEGDFLHEYSLSIDPYYDREISRARMSSPYILNTNNYKKLSCSQFSLFKNWMIYILKKNRKFNMYNKYDILDILSLFETMLKNINKFMELSIKTNSLFILNNGVPSYEDSILHEISEDIEKGLLVDFYLLLIYSFCFFQRDTQNLKLQLVKKYGDKFDLLDMKKIDIFINKYELPKIYEDKGIDCFLLDINKIKNYFYLLNNLSPAKKEMFKNKI